MLAAYADNASYEENDSLSQAQAFASACRLLLSPQHSFKRSVAGGRGGSEIELAPEILQGQLDAAREFVAAKIASQRGAVTHVDFGSFRE